MIARATGLLLVAFLALPVLALVLATPPATLLDALGRPATRAALALSLRTTAAALALTLALGTPLAWLLSRDRLRWARPLVELPVVLPPAVLGLALLEAFGRAGFLGPIWAAVGLRLPFSTAAVVLAQVAVGAPLFVLAAATAFRAVDADHLLVARTLGASPARAFWAIAVPAAAPGLAAAAALAWARALGEFGATLFFAGSLPGRTQTLPLAIYGALERDLDEARATAVLLVAAAGLVLLGVRLLGGEAHRAR